MGQAIHIIHRIVLLHLHVQIANVAMMFSFPFFVLTKERVMMMASPFSNLLHVQAPRGLNKPSYLKCSIDQKQMFPWTKISSTDTCHVGNVEMIIVRISMLGKYFQSTFLLS